MAPAEHVGCNDAVLVRVEVLAWADDLFPPAAGRVTCACRADQVAVACQRVEDEDRIVAGVVELAEGLVGDTYVREVFACLSVERADVEELSVPNGIAITPSARDRRPAHERAQLCVGDEVGGK